MKDYAINRRQIIKMGFQSATATALLPLVPFANFQSAPGVVRGENKRAKVVVVGAGAFGGWSALHLLRQGFNVTLIDQYGPGNNQASSGGETRLIRAFYGDRKIYFDLTLRAIELWKENEPLMRTKILHQNGLAVFLPGSNDEMVEAAVPMYKKAGLTFEKVSHDDARKRWPAINFEDIDHVMYDPIAGFLEARRGCFEIKDLFIKEGGEFIQQKVEKEIIKGGKATSVLLSDDQEIEADYFLFACGPWLVRSFPELTKKVKITRQVAFFFASPPAESDLMENKLPTWFNKMPSGGVDVYGVPGCEYRGFKIAAELTDIITHKFDTYNRYSTPEELEFVKSRMEKRFPKMKGRPLIEQRICQYAETPDSHFILDKHPEISNVWIMGGGSGHGYKMGASMGELAANTIAGKKELISTFSLQRLIK